MTIFAVTYRYSDDVATRDNLRTKHRDYLRGLADKGPVRAENPVIASEQHVSGSRPRHHRRDKSQHDRPVWPSDSPT